MRSDMDTLVGHGADARPETPCVSSCPLSVLVPPASAVVGRTILPAGSAGNRPRRGPSIRR